MHNRPKLPKAHKLHEPSCSQSLYQPLPIAWPMMTLTWCICDLQLALFCLCVTKFRECPSRPVCVVRVRKWSPPRALGVRLQFLFLPSYSPPRTTTQAKPTQHIHSTELSLRHVQTEPFNLLTSTVIYLFIDIFLFFLQRVLPFCFIHLFLILTHKTPPTLGHIWYCLVHSFLKENVNMWHDHHYWPHSFVCEHVYWTLEAP